MPTFVCPVDSMMRDGIADHIGEKRGEKHTEKLHRCVSWLCRADSDSSQRFTLKIETASERGAGGETTAENAQSASQQSHSVKRAAFGCQLNSLFNLSLSSYLISKIHCPLGHVIISGLWFLAMIK